MKQEYSLEYDQEFPCITIPELRWMLAHAGRHSAFYTWLLLRATTGMRPAECTELTLYNFTPDLRVLTYVVRKAKHKKICEIEHTYHRQRRFTLDPWVIEELKRYLLKTCRVVNGVFVSPNDNQRLFPWKNKAVPGVYWCRLRASMNAAGFDANRKATEHWAGGKRCRVYVMRPHILRHFAGSVAYYRLGMDVIRTRDWIKHYRSETTNRYLHNWEKLQAPSADYLATASWATILGYDEEQQTMIEYRADSQTNLEMF